MNTKERIDSSDSDLLLLYAHLERIARKKYLSDDYLKGIESHFDEYFRSIEQNPTGMESVPKLTLLNSDKWAKEAKITPQIAKVAGVDISENIPINGDSVLLRAMSIKTKNNSRKKTLDKIINIIIKYCPFQIKKSHDNIKGASPINLAIALEDIEILKTMSMKIKKIKAMSKTEKIDIECAEGEIFQDTVMMAGTPLGIASLICNKRIFNIILKKFEQKLHLVNEKGDTLIHSMIKYAHVQPNKLEAILEMLRYIIDCKFEKEKSKKNKMSDSAVRQEDYRNQIKIMLMTKNKEELTPLQLAAKRQQFEIFEVVLQHEIYIPKHTNDSLFHYQKYDITEIETLALNDGVKGTHLENIKTEHHESVLEYVLHHRTDKASRFTNITPVKDVIKEKWKYYSWPFRIWFLMYFIFMGILSYAAVRRSQIRKSLGSNGEIQYSYQYRVTQDVYVTTVSFLGAFFALIFISIESRIHYIKRFRTKTSTHFMKRLKENFSLPYSNFMFRVYFVIMSLLLILDCVLASSAGQNKISWYENYCLIFAIITGWYLVLFFLQANKVFSFYTVLIQRVILDMLKFAVVMIIFLVAFSIAMFMVMQGADTNDDDFDNIGKTMVKMLTIMLGIGELGVLFQAREPLLAVLVFVLYVLLTTILLLNALIAMMSNSCTGLMDKNADVHYRLQKLSVILFLESFLPLYLCKEVGEIEKVNHFENIKKSKKYLPSKRRMWTRRSVTKDISNASVASDVPMQDADNKNFNLQELLSKFRKQSISKKIKPNKIAQSPEVRKHIEIIDTTLQRCDNCGKEALTGLQTQDITEKYTNLTI